MASKKAVLVYILEILRDETDANHTLSQEEIRSILAKKYELTVDRKTLGRHLNDLYESGNFNIECEESALGTDGSIRRTNFYMIHPFEEAELHLLIDGLLASRHISVNQRKDLIDKVSALGGRAQAIFCMMRTSLNCSAVRHRGLPVWVRTASSSAC